MSSLGTAVRRLEGSGAGASGGAVRRKSRGAACASLPRSCSLESEAVFGGRRQPRGYSLSAVVPGWRGLSLGAARSPRAFRSGPLSLSEALRYFFI